MSASEKLKALDAELDPAPWRARASAGWCELMVSEDEMRRFEAVRNALPQIVAVVEAAENGPRYSNRDLERPFGGDSNSWMETGPLAAALSALNEALS